jgi:hypothetical protein
MNDNELSMRNSATKVTKHYCAGRSICSCLLHVVKVIGHAVVCIHTGCASASTSARNFNGRSSGSAGRHANPAATPTRLAGRQVDQRCTGQGIYQQVDIAAFVVGAVQYRAEYAWLVVGNRATVAQTAARCISSTREGRMGILSGRKLLKC